MNLSYVVSNTGCVLEVDASLGPALQSAGLEIFASVALAAARFTSSDEGKQPLVYFDNV